MIDKTREDLLAHYRTKPIQRFLQMDGFHTPGDEFTGKGEDGESVVSTLTQELMGTPGRSMPVRLLIHEDADPEQARRLLRRMLEGLDQAFEMLCEEEQAELFKRAGIEREPPS